jgi:hypothetical protein
MTVSNYSLLSASSLPSCRAAIGACRQGLAGYGRHDFNSIVGELGSLRCCRCPCLAKKSR